MLKEALRGLAAKLNTHQEGRLKAVGSQFKVARSSSKSGLLYGSLELDGPGWRFEQRRVQVCCSFDARDKVSSVSMATSNLQWLCDFMDPQIGKVVPCQDDDHCRAESACYWLAYSDLDEATKLGEQNSQFEAEVCDALGKVILNLPSK